MKLQELHMIRESAHASIYDDAGMTAREIANERDTDYYKQARAGYIWQNAKWQPATQEIVHQRELEVKRKKQDYDEYRKKMAKFKPDEYVPGNLLMADEVTRKRSYWDHELKQREEADQEIVEKAKRQLARTKSGV